jgi:hypothetical protein
VAERIERPEPDGLALAGQDAVAADGGSSGEGRSGGGATGTRVVRAQLGVAAVSVAVPRIGQVLACVGRVAHARGGGRARDVGDRRDVVPVDPVADPEQKPGRQDADVGGGLGDGGNQGDGVDQRAFLRDGRCYRTRPHIATCCN